jgi:hypothetical protein
MTATQEEEGGGGACEGRGGAHEVSMRWTHRRRRERWEPRMKIWLVVSGGQEIAEGADRGEGEGEGEGGGDGGGRGEGG